MTLADIIEATFHFSFYASFSESIDFCHGLQAVPATVLVTRPGPGSPEQARGAEAAAVAVTGTVTGSD